MLNEKQNSFKWTSNTNTSFIWNKKISRRYIWDVKSYFKFRRALKMQVQNNLNSALTCGTYFIWNIFVLNKLPAIFRLKAVSAVTWNPWGLKILKLRTHRWSEIELQISTKKCSIQRNSLASLVLIEIYKGLKVFWSNSFNFSRP